MVRDAGLRALDAVADEPQLARHHRLHAVRAHLLDQLGDAAGARAEYELAARLTLSIPERAYLEARAHRRFGGLPDLAGGSDGDDANSGG